VKLDNFSIRLNKKQYYIVLSLLVLLGVVSLIAGMYNTWNNIVDFQQPAACVFISGENPYLFHLEGKYGDNWSPPNYLHSLYFLLSPLCIFDDSTARLVWGFINIGFAIWISYTLCKMANHREYFILVLLVFFASLSFRNGIGNQQNQMLVLAFFILSMQANSSFFQGFFGALSFLKYSFAGSWIGMFLYHNKYAVVWSVLLVIMMMISGAYWISSGNILIDLLGPFKVASKIGNIAYGSGDILTIFEYLVGKEYEYRIIVAALLLLLNIVIVAFITKKSTDPLFILSVAGVSALIFVTHLRYDAVFLLPAFIYFLSRSGILSLIGFFIIIYNWQITKILDIFKIHNASLNWTIIHLFLYVILLVSLIFAEKHKDKKPLLILEK